jgi:hypothetical protein
MLHPVRLFGDQLNLLAPALGTVQSGRVSVSASKHNIHDHGTVAVGDFILFYSLSLTQSHTNTEKTCIAFHPLSFFIVFSRKRVTFPFPSLQSASGTFCLPSQPLSRLKSRKQKLKVTSISNVLRRILGSKQN